MNNEIKNKFMGIDKDMTINAICNIITVVICCSVTGITILNTSHILVGIIVGVLVGVIVGSVTERIFWTLVTGKDTELPDTKEEINMTFPKEISDEIYSNMDYEFQIRIENLMKEEWYKVLHLVSDELNKESETDKKHRRDEIETLYELIKNREL